MVCILSSNKYRPLDLTPDALKEVVACYLKFILYSFQIANEAFSGCVKYFSMHRWVATPVQALTPLDCLRHIP